VARQPSLLARDHVHATGAGYATMAKLYADAIRACAGEEL
jgi:lysophospholipase L1-like esterase